MGPLPPLRSAPLVLAVGALSAVVLASAAFVDLGDPVASARARIDQSAQAQAALVRTAAETIRRRPALPAAPRGLDVVLGDARVGAPSPDPAPGLREPTESPIEPLFGLLVDAAVAASRSGDLLGALAYVEDALDRAPSARRAPAARLAAMRWWSALGATREVARHRRLLAEREAGRVDGTSTHLLATLVPPVDANGAHRILGSDAASLPAPSDRWEVVRGELRFVPDPWWSAVRARLERAAPELDWAAAFRQPGRRAAAAVALVGGRPETDGDAWTFSRIAGAVLASRATQDGVRVVAVDPADVLEAVRVEAERGPELVRGPLLSDAGPRQARALALGPGVDVPFTVYRPDPAVVAQPEIRRLALVRSALLGLAAMLLLGSIVSARAMNRAQRLTELRSTFVASVSHDLRTPTQAILLMAETLEQERVATASSRARYHTQIRREAERLRRLVEDLLDGARVDRGDGARIERRALDAGAFFDDLERAMADRAEAAGAHLSVERQAMPATIHVDPDGVRRAVWNLFENALLHGAQGEDAARVTVEFAVRDSVLQVEVRDEGPGVPARFRESVFEPFERVADRRRREGIAKDTGTGLGLAIVRALSRAHGGEARLAPTEHGARFVATFPAAGEEGAA